jgi:hypothetical protein
LSGTLPVTGGSNISVVAHLSRAGDATLTVFENMFRRLPAGRSLLHVRHVSAGPPLSVRFDGRLVKEDLRIREWGTTTVCRRDSRPITKPRPPRDGCSSERGGEGLKFLQNEGTGSRAGAVAPSEDQAGDSIVLVGDLHRLVELRRRGELDESVSGKISGV